MAFGIALIYFAVILWSMFKKFSTALLALTAIFVYITMVLDLLDFYSVINSKSTLAYKGIAFLEYVPTLLVLISFIFTLIIFFREEKRL